MYEETNFSIFCDRFASMNRDNNFSYDGKKALFDYLEEYEESTDSKIELDIIALCCKYSEYKDIEEFWKDYDKSDYPTLDKIEDATTIIRIDDDAFLIQQF